MRLVLRKMMMFLCILMVAAGVLKGTAYTAWSSMDETQDEFPDDKGFIDDTDVDHSTDKEAEFISKAAIKLSTDAVVSESGFYSQAIAVDLDCQNIDLEHPGKYDVTVAIETDKEVIRVNSLNWIYDEEEKESSASFIISDKEETGSDRKDKDEVVIISDQIIEIAASISLFDGMTHQKVAEDTLEVKGMIDTVEPRLSFAETEGVFIYLHHEDTPFLYLQQAIERRDGVEEVEIQYQIPVTMVIKERNFDCQGYQIELSKLYDQVEYSCEDDEIRYSFLSRHKGGKTEKATLLLPAIQDCAGLWVKGEKVPFKDSTGTTSFFDIQEDHTAAAAFIVDAEAPSGIGDNGIFVFDADAKSVSYNGVDCFCQAGSLDLSLYIEDGNGSGMKNVSFWMDGGEGCFETSDFQLAEKESDQRYRIPCFLLEGVEADKVTLYVKAEDLAGNSRIGYTTFSVDTKAPEVTVRYNNNDVRNDHYFKEGRVLTVTVSDLHFDPSLVSVSSISGFSGWTSSSHGYTGTVRYMTDGSYSFSMDVKDLCGNTAAIDYTDGGNNAAPTEFVIDSTKPMVAVTFDNNAASNDVYYNQDRIANLLVSEMNFDPSDVTIIVRQDHDGRTKEYIADCAFSHFQILHSGKLAFSEEGVYSMEVRMVDQAGNEADPVTIAPFVIDKTLPRITVQGLEQNQAYKEQVLPVIEIRDENYADHAYSINWIRQTLQGAKTLSCEEITKEELADGILLFLPNAEMAEDSDGLYSLTISVTDLAGNRACLDPIQYSVNRFGSVFAPYDEGTIKMLQSGCTNTMIPLQIVEINPNILYNCRISRSLNGTSAWLEEGIDYTIQRMEDQSGWCRQLYSILPHACQDSDGTWMQGDYCFSLYSRDEAGHDNIGESFSEEPYDMLAFTLDTEAPKACIMIDGVQADNVSKKGDTVLVSVSFGDNQIVASGDIYLNNKHFRTLNREEIEKGIYSFTVGKADYKQTVSAVFKDLAGNETSLDTCTFYVFEEKAGKIEENKHVLEITAVIIAALAAGLAFIFIRSILSHFRHTKRL